MGYVIAFTPEYFAPVSPDPSPEVVANCDCDCGYETKTFAEMCIEVATAMGYATQLVLDGTPTERLARLQTGFVALIKQTLNMQQRRVIEDITEIANERYFSWALQDGVTRYCTDDNLETCRNKLRAARIFEAYIINTQGSIISRLVKGIPFDFHSGGDLGKSTPTRYEVRSCIEVWPPPAVSDDNLFLVVRGQLAASDMVDDADTPNCTSDLVVMRTIAFLKSSKGHSDASDYMSQYRQSIGILNADSHIDERYIPGQVCERWCDRLTHVMEPRVYDDTP